MQIVFSLPPSPGSTTVAASAFTRPVSMRTPSNREQSFLPPSSRTGRRSIAAIRPQRTTLDRHEVGRLGPPRATRGTVDDFCFKQ